jgi:hypothetical protein
MTAIESETITRKFPSRFLTILFIWLVPALICFTVPDWWILAVLAFPLSLPWIVTPLAALALSLVRLFQRDYWAAGRLLLFPILTVCLFWYLKIGGDRVWFELHRPCFDKAIAKLAGDNCASADWITSNLMIDAADCGPPMIVVFEFGGFLSMWHGVVYDQSDEFAKPAEQRSESWKKNKSSECLACSIARWNPESHFYLASGSVGPC